MRNANIILAVNEAVRLVNVAYEPNVPTNKQPSFTFKTMDDSIAVDDLVVIPTGTRWGMTVAKVTEVDVDFDIESDIELRWIIDTVDETAHKEILATEERVIKLVTQAERRRKRASIRESLLDAEADDVLREAAKLAPPEHHTSFGEVEEDLTPPEQAPRAD
jgi:hypothetical protein